MAHFYTSCKGHRGEATRLGAKNSGARTVTAGWQGAIQVLVWHNHVTGRDEFSVKLMPWGSSGGETREIASGILDSEITDPFIPALIA